MQLIQLMYKKMRTGAEAEEVGDDVQRVTLHAHRQHPGQQQS
jgi:hypothetical protein